jgi:hypothetical protein
MPKVVFTHAVVDVGRWLKGKADREQLGSNVVDYVAEDGSNNIAITVDVEDFAALQAMLAAPPAEVQAQMDEHGVVPPITTYVEA